MRGNFTVENVELICMFLDFCNTYYYIVVQCTYILIYCVSRLSERNVVELVKKLVELKLVDVLYTSDGKEYLTSQHLTKEILDELAVQGGM